MLELNDSKTILEGRINLSDCEKPFGVIWLSGQSQASLYIGDSDDIKDEIENFISGEQKCYIDLSSYIHYLRQIKLIADKFSSMFRGPFDFIDEAIARFSNMPEDKAYLILKYVRGGSDRYIRILNDKDPKTRLIGGLLYGDGALENGTAFRSSFVGGISVVKIEKSEDRYTISIYLAEDWREIIMNENGSKVTVDKVIEIFNHEMEKLLAEDFSVYGAAQVFGIKYAPFLKKNEHKFSHEDIVHGSSYNEQDAIDGIENGIALSPQVLWEVVDDNKANHDELSPLKIVFSSSYSSSLKRNRIIFGAPGTGKSFRLNKESNDLVKNGGYLERVTFHPDYTYAHFVGTYKPVPKIDDDTKKEIVSYEFVPGPFIRVLVEALEFARTDSPKPCVLVIEEINRANVAAVFGDVFQLLDRNADCVSNFPVNATEDVKKYLSSRLKRPIEEFAQLRIPNNMFIWASMNSADQGVFPMDTAFKRRWDFTYIGIDENESKIAGKEIVLGTGDNARVVEWNELRKAINEKLAKAKNINEDKMLGPFFLNDGLFDGATVDQSAFIEAFKNKVIMYLFEDVVRGRPNALFNAGEIGDIDRYSSICDAFDEKGVKIFSSLVSDRFTKKP